MFRGSLLKYVDQRTDSRGQSLFFPGANGFPYRGVPPGPTRDDEYEKIPLSCDAQVRTFFLNNPDDLRDYREIIDRVSNGWYTIRDRKCRWHKAKDCFVIFLEWIEVYSQTPNGREPFSITQGSNNAAQIPRLSEDSILQELFPDSPGRQGR